MQQATRSSWITRLGTLLIVLGAGLWIVRVASDHVSASSQAASRHPEGAVAPANVSPATLAPLPQAWASPSPSAVPSPTSTFSAPPSPTDEMPSPTPVPQAPTLTATPIHLPASEDPTYIAIPSIDVATKVVTVGITEEPDGYGGTQKVWEVADYAAGFHQGMARPGNVGNTVISGHNNIRGEVFRDLYKLRPGDAIYVWVGDVRYHYAVSAVYRLPIKDAPPEVLQDNLRWIMPTEDQRLTLVTCWPYWSNTHRIVVVAFPAGWDTVAADEG